MIIIGYTLFCIFYLGAPHLVWREPIIVPALRLDTQIPFTTASVWIYISQFALLFCAIWYAANTRARTIAFYSMLLASAIAAVVFIFFPTILPRYYIEDVGVTSFLWHGLYAVDVPSNCFPSLHAALATLAISPLYQRGGIFKIIAPFWAIAIMFAALLTKQHVTLDILGGLILAISSCIIITNYIRGVDDLA